MSQSTQSVYGSKQSNPWIKRKRSQVSEKVFFEEIYADAEITSRDPSSNESSPMSQYTDTQFSLWETPEDVTGNSYLDKLNLVLDLLKEDTMFFQSLRDQVAKHNKSHLNALEMTKVFNLRRDRLMTMIETNHSMWLLRRMEQAGEAKELSRILCRYNLVKPCYFSILEEPVKTPKRAKQSSVKLGHSISMSMPMAFSDDMNVTGSSLVSYVFLPFTQGSIGKVPACTSISFTACVAMRKHLNSTSAKNCIPWKDIIFTGVHVWKMWRRNQIKEISNGDVSMSMKIKKELKLSGSSSMIRTFQTVHDLEKMEKLTQIFDMLGGKPKEFGGYIDGTIPDNILRKGTDEEIAEYQKNYPSLEQSLNKMAQYGTRTVGVVTIGIISLSVYVENVTHKHTSKARYLIFDSHSSSVRPGQCTLASADTGKVAAKTIATLCSATYTNNQEYAEAFEPISVSSENVCETYCIYIFPQTDIAI